MLLAVTVENEELVFKYVRNLSQSQQRSVQNMWNCFHKEEEDWLLTNMSCMGKTLPDLVAPTSDFITPPAETNVINNWPLTKTKIRDLWRSRYLRTVPSERFFPSEIWERCQDDAPAPPLCLSLAKYLMTAGPWSCSSFIAMSIETLPCKCLFDELFIELVQTI